MATESKGPFDYKDFRKSLRQASLTADQRSPLDQRLSILESFLDHDNSIPEFDQAPGSLTIIDLSCPFVDHDMACSLFNIAMAMYLDSPTSSGRVIALDEAHTYMTDSPGATALTDSLLYAVHLQRHNGLRVVVSTQEPSVSTQIIDLCTAIIVHRFTSPAWYKKLSEHIKDPTALGNRGHLLDQIVRLEPSEALVYCPTAKIGVAEDCVSTSDVSQEMFRVRIRRKVTWDAGQSVRSTVT